MGRTPGSARFDPYLKVQYLDPTSIAWVDVQRGYSTATEALDALAQQAAEATGVGAWRLMAVHERGRAPVGPQLPPHAVQALVHLGLGEAADGGGVRVLRQLAEDLDGAGWDAGWLLHECDDADTLEDA